MKQVIIVWAASFTGGTWVALVAGSNENAIYLGNPKRFEDDLRSSQPQVCKIHGSECEFWRPILNKMEGKQNILIEAILNQPRSTVVIKNPTPDYYYKLQSDNRISIKELIVLRDLRPMLASYMRKNEDSDIFDTLNNWGLTAINSTKLYLKKSDVILKHDLVSKKPEILLENLSKLTGVLYDEKSLSYWEFDHHPNNGNKNTVALISSYQGLASNRNVSEFYELHLQKAISTKDVVLKDDRWKIELNRYELFVIDKVIGGFNEEFGYPRDEFSIEEKLYFEAQFHTTLSIRKELVALRNIIPDSEAAAVKKFAENISSLFNKDINHISFLEKIYGTAGLVDWSLDIDPAISSVLENRMEQAKIRVLPYPFDGAVTITSDTDRSTPEIVKAYIRQFTEEHGMDFSDSTWIQNNGLVKHAGSGFLTADLRWRAAADNPNLHLSPIELANYYHKGSIDHWHSFYTRGPRFFVFDGIENKDKNSIRIFNKKEQNITDPLWGTAYFAPPAVGIISKKFINYEVLSISWKTKTTSNNYKLKEITSNPLSNIVQGDKKIRLFELEFDLYSKNAIPFLSDIESGTLYYENGTSEIDALIVFNYTREITQRRLDYLSQSIGINPILLTLHAQWHFMTETKLVSNQALTESHDQENPDLTHSYFLPRRVCGIRISPLADDPDSYAYITDWLSSKYGCVLIRGVPPANRFRKKEVVGSSIFSLLTPMRRRDGGWIYNFNTQTGKITNTCENKVLNGKTIARNFVQRFSSILDSIEGKKWAVDAHYTHLGNLFPKEDDIPKPYFDQKLFARLRKLHFGIGAEGKESRVWFVKPSVLGTYAMLATNIVNNTSRDEGNNIFIKRTLDLATNNLFPKTKNQLFGLTFIVNEPAKARIWLDDEQVKDLSLNYPKNGELPSITIYSSKSVLSLMRHLLPQLVLAKCRCFGNVTISDSQDSPLGGSVFLLSSRQGYLEKFLTNYKVKNKFSLGFLPFTVDGAQALRVVYRLRGNASNARLIISTSDGGKFIFCENGTHLKKGYTATSKLTSSYSHDDWNWSIIPFSTLEWLKLSNSSKHVDSQRIKLPLPMRYVSNIEWNWDGDNSSAIEIADISYLRPNSENETSLNSLQLGGLVTENADLLLRKVDALGNALDYLEKVRSDSLGQFIFSDLDSGAYQITNTDGKILRFFNLVCSDFSSDFKRS